MDDVYISWRIAMCKVWSVPWTTHWHLLPYLASVIYPELWFSKICVKFIKIALNSDNIIVRTITNVDLNGTHSVMVGNWRHLRSKYGMEECNVMKSCDEKCKNECKSVRACEQIRVMCSWRDRCDMTLINKEECSTIIEFLCAS